MWIDDVDVARRLDTIERCLSDEEPELVQSFHALSHPSLGATTRRSGTAAMRPLDQRNDLATLGLFCAMVLVSIGLVTGSWAALLSAVSLIMATAAVVGVLALLSDKFPHPRRFPLR
jgi:Protein of unknown function (DUF3040)